MKNRMILLMLALLMMAGCSQQISEEAAAETTAPTTEVFSTEATTIETTEPEPITEDAEILADQVPALLMFKNRGDRLDVVGEYDEEHFAVKTDSGYGLVLKNLVRIQSEEPYESWTGYAHWNTEIFDNFYLEGDPVQTLAMNTKVEVLEDLGFCLLVKTEDRFGFTGIGRISKWHISVNSGGGSSDDGESSGGQDGGDITMMEEPGVQNLSFISQTGEVTGEAQVLADGTPIVLGYFKRGDKVPRVTENGWAEEKEGYDLLYWEGLYSYVDKNLTLRSGQAAYEPWDGFAAGKAKAYDNFHMLGEPLAGIWMNVPVHVLCELGDIYLVEVNETTAYMAKDAVKQQRTVVNYGGGSSQSDSSDSGDEWSDPVL